MEEQGDRLSTPELLSFALLLYVAGHETTVNLIGNGTLALLRHRDELRRWAADPTMDAQAIDELLRFDGPVQQTVRVPLEPVRFGDVEVPANTMVMTVFERTREIGILRALGWKRRRVLGLVLGEAALLGLGGAILGSLLGLIGVKALAQTPMGSIFINADLPPRVLAAGMGLGLVLSLVGGIYPALRAAALEPTEALRHE